VECTASLFQCGARLQYAALSTFSAKHGWRAIAGIVPPLSSAGALEIALQASLASSGGHAGLTIKMVPQARLAVHRASLADMYGVVLPACSPPAYWRSGIGALRSIAVNAGGIAEMKLA
jgi:hypothetical protein